MLNFSLTPQVANYIGQLIAERPIKEAGLVALDWQKQGDAEQARLNKEAADEVEKTIREKIANEKPAKK